MAWVRWWTSNWRGSARVAELSLAERGLYVELLNLQVANGPFALDFAKLARQVRCDRRELEAMWPAVAQFFNEAGGLWSNSLMEAEVARGTEQRVKASEAGKASAQQRARQRPLERPLDSCSNETATTVGVSVPTHPNPSPSPRESQTPEAPSEPAPFDAEAAPPGRRRKPPEPVNVEFGRWWERRFLESRGAEWRWSAKERAAVDAVRGHACGDLAALQARAENMLAVPDAWTAQNAAPSILASRWNQYAVVVSKTPARRTGSAAVREMIRTGEVTFDQPPVEKPDGLF